MESLVLGSFKSLQIVRFYKINGWSDLEFWKEVGMDLLSYYLRICLE
jgi:hypothetical protein